VEGARRHGRDPRRFRDIAHGSAAEIRGALDRAGAWGWQVDSADARGLLDRELGSCAAHPPEQVQGHANCPGRAQRARRNKALSGRELDVARRTRSSLYRAYTELGAVRTAAVNGRRSPSTTASDSRRLRLAGSAQRMTGRTAGKPPRNDPGDYEAHGGEAVIEVTLRPRATAYRLPPTLWARGEMSHTFGDDERVAAKDDRDVMVPTRESPTLPRLGEL
jgi:hypothetical protein